MGADWRELHEPGHQTKISGIRGQIGRRCNPREEIVIIDETLPKALLGLEPLFVENDLWMGHQALVATVLLLRQGFRRI